jgi:hypothetical protein
MERLGRVDAVEKLRNCRFSRGQHTGCWAGSGTLTLVIDGRSSPQDFFSIGQTRPFEGAV